MQSYPHRHHQIVGAKVPLSSPIDNQAWDIGRGLERAEYIEAFNFSMKDDAPSDAEATAYSRTGKLKQDDILNWVHQRGAFKPLEHADANARLNGGVRLLILERAYYQPPSFNIKKSTYRAVAQRFHLDEHTLLASSSESGLSSHSIELDEKGNPERLNMIIKASQKFQVGNYSLSFSHDLVTGFSTGILHGTGVTQHGGDYELWLSHPAAELFELLKASARFWAHPLCLPVLVLHHHLQRTQYFCTVILSNQLTDVQEQLGVMRAGRLHGIEAQSNLSTLPVQQAKTSLKDLTAGMSNLAYETIWCCGVSDWQCETMVFLRDVLAEISGLVKDLKGTQAMKAHIRYLAATAASVKRHNVSMKENTHADMSVLYSIISQVDNRLNAKMAASSSRDSAAMKTLAFLTILFLPGTYIATIFSTGMFNWHIDSGSQQAAAERANNARSMSARADTNATPTPEKTISDLFWVYWAVTVPLTILVAAAWRIWWSHEKKHFDQDIGVEIRAMDDSRSQRAGAVDEGETEDVMAAKKPLPLVMAAYTYVVKGRGR